MKGYFRFFLITSFAFWVVLKTVPGISLDSDWQTFILICAAIFVSTFFVKPVLKLIFLPFNMITFNLLAVVINAGLLFFLSFVVPQFKVKPFIFEGLTYNGIVVPQLPVSQLLSLLVAAIIITVITAALNWISD